MVGDLAYRIGTLVGTGVGVVERGIPTPEEPVTDGAPDAPDPDDPGAENEAAGNGGLLDDGDLLVNSVLGAAAGWMVKKVLRPRRVSWPRVIVAGIGATVASDLVGRVLGPDAEDRDRAYDEDPDALLVRLGAGIAMAAGYASLLYPRLPGSPLAKGLVFGVMEIAAAPHGGLVRVASETPGLKFPLRDLAVPIDEDAGPLSAVTFGLALGLLYRPGSDDDEAESHPPEDE